MPNGFVFVVSAPSGTGKSTLCRALLKKRPKLSYSVSCTTRPPRPTEVDGKDYFFISEKEFKQKANAGEFLEWARVHGHLYGTPKKPLRDKTEKGFDVLLDVDPQGALAVKELFPGTVCVFICPPSWKALEARLRGRGQDDDGAIATRLANARRELTYLSHYDYLVVNQDVKQAVQDLLAILRAEHRRLTRLPHEVKNLLTLEERT